MHAWAALIPSTRSAGEALSMMIDGVKQDSPSWDNVRSVVVGERSMSGSRSRACRTGERDGEREWMRKRDIRSGGLMAGLV